MLRLWFQQKVNADPALDEVQIDKLARFVFQVKDYFIAAGRTLSTLANVDCRRSIVKASYSPKDLEERQLYVGVVEMVFHETTRQ